MRVTAANHRDGLIRIAERANTLDNLRGVFVCVPPHVEGSIINFIALFQFMAAFFLAVALLCTGQVYAALFAPLVALILVDLLIRWLVWFAADECDRPLFNADAGGAYEGGIPVWCAAAVWLVIFGLAMLRPQ